MLKKRKFFWVTIPLCLVLIALAWGYHLYNKPHGSAADGTVAISLNADSLFAQYQRDEHSADQLYLGKVIEVSGKIAEIQQNTQSEVLILSTQSGSGGINCQLFPGEDKREPPYHTGDPVKIRGRCTGFLMDVNLADCVVSR
jgi:hypothetical protein